MGKSETSRPFSFFTPLVLAQAYNLEALTESKIFTDLSPFQEAANAANFACSVLFRISYVGVLF